MSACSATERASTARLSALDEIEAELLATGVPDGDRAFNLTWHDWLNLRSLTETSRVIALARAAQRENSRGAHFREDFPEPGDLATLAPSRSRGRADGRIDDDRASRCSSPSCSRANRCSPTRPRRSRQAP